jgi:hypothetical protein
MTLLEHTELVQYTIARWITSNTGHKWLWISWSFKDQHITSAPAQQTADIMNKASDWSGEHAMFVVKISTTRTVEQVPAIVCPTPNGK